jgi:hypothetical protein
MKPDNPNEYNGWTNYETWLVNLWMDNTEEDQSLWAREAESLYRYAEAGPYDWSTRKFNATTALAEALKDYWERSAEQITGNSGPFADLLTAALGSVNWREIAGHLIDECVEDDDGQETQESKARL